MNKQYSGEVPSVETAAPAAIPTYGYEVDFGALRDATTFDSAELKACKAYTSVMGPKGVDTESVEWMQTAAPYVAAAAMSLNLFGVMVVETACESERIGNDQVTAQACEVSGNILELFGRVSEGVSDLVGANSFRPEHITVAPTR